jgi:hypothetical protein
MAESKPLARVHRFRGEVAVSLLLGPTAYFDPAVARVLAAALIQAATDCERVDFCESKFQTVAIMGEAGK